MAGFTRILPAGLEAGDLIAVVHAADANAAENASQALLPLIQLADQAPAGTPVLVTRLPA